MAQGWYFGIIPFYSGFVVGHDFGTLKAAKAAIRKMRRLAAQRRVTAKTFWKFWERMNEK